MLRAPPSPRLCLCGKGGSPQIPTSVILSKFRAANGAEGPAIAIHSPRKNGCPTLAAPLSLRQGWEPANLTSPQYRAQRTEPKDSCLHPYPSPKNGCPTLAAPLSLRLGWEPANLTSPQYRAQRTEPKDPCLHPFPSPKNGRSEMGARRNIVTWTHELASNNLAPHRRILRHSGQPKQEARPGEEKHADCQLFQLHRQPRPRPAEP